MIIALLVHWAPALTIPQAKADVRAALAAADGRTKDRTVRAAVDALAALNPTVAPARATALLGKWKQIAREARTRAAQPHPGRPEAA